VPGSCSPGATACNADVHRIQTSSTDGSTGSLPDLTTINFVTPLFPPMDGIVGVAIGVKSRGGGGMKSGCGGGGPVWPTRVHRQSMPAPLILNSNNYRLPSNTLSPDVSNYKFTSCILAYQP